MYYPSIRAGADVLQFDMFVCDDVQISRRSSSWRQGVWQQRLDHNATTSTSIDKCYPNRSHKSWDTRAPARMYKWLDTLRLRSCWREKFFSELFSKIYHMIHITSTFIQLIYYHRILRLFEIVSIYLVYYYISVSLHLLLYTYIYIYI